jgi:hypothetical protein
MGTMLQSQAAKSDKYLKPSMAQVCDLSNVWTNKICVRKVNKITKYELRHCERNAIERGNRSSPMANKLDAVNLAEYLHLISPSCNS